MFKNFSFLEFIMIDITGFDDKGEIVHKLRPRGKNDFKE